MNAWNHVGLGLGELSMEGEEIPSSTLLIQSPPQYASTYLSRFHFTDPASLPHSVHSLARSYPKFPPI